MGVGVSAIAQTNLPLYTDILANGFQDWSWGTHSLSSTSPVHSGTNAISFSGSALGAISVEHPDFNPAPYTNLTFWANGGSGGGQILQVYVQFGANRGPACQLLAPAANTWQQYSISTNTLIGSTLNLTTAIPSGTGRKFWRAVWQP